MWETIYEWVFNPKNNESYVAFSQNHGYEYAGWILVITSILVAAVYYFYFGNKSPKYATTMKWFFSALISAVLVLLVTANVIGFMTFEAQRVTEIVPEVWLFSIYNFAFSFIFYFIISMLFKYGSKDAKYTPF